MTMCRIAQGRSRLVFMVEYLLSNVGLMNCMSSKF